MGKIFNVDEEVKKVLLRDDFKNEEPEYKATIAERARKYIQEYITAGIYIPVEEWDKENIANDAALPNAEDWYDLIGLPNE